MPDDTPDLPVEGGTPAAYSYGEGLLAEADFAEARADTFPLGAPERLALQQEALNLLFRAGIEQLRLFLAAQQPAPTTRTRRPATTPKGPTA